jgi:hypothetical protein
MRLVATSVDVMCSAGRKMAPCDTNERMKDCEIKGGRDTGIRCVCREMNKIGIVESDRVGHERIWHGEEGWKWLLNAPGES